MQLLDNEASYLGQLGEDVTDVNQLWGFAVQQADNCLSPVGPTPGFRDRRFAWRSPAACR